MCEWIIQKLERTPSWINHIWFSYEAHFHLNSAVNNHNNIFWESEQPKEISKRLLKGPKVTTLSPSMLGMSYWLPTVNAARYRDVIKNFKN